MGILNAEQLVVLRDAAVSEAGNRLDVAIRLTRLRQGHIATSLRVFPSFISDLKYGRRRTMAPGVAERFADYFGCTVEDLFPGRPVAPQLPDLPRTVERARGARAGTKRPRRAPRKRLDVLYPLPAHLEKQRVALFEMLTDARLAQGRTLQEVGDQLNRTRQQVEQWESAVRSVRIDTFMEWADALGYRLCLEPDVLGVSAPVRPT